MTRIPPISSTLRLRRSAWIAALAITAQGCVMRYGPSVDTFSQSARGVRVEVTGSDEGTLAGELLEAGQTGLLLLGDGGVLWRSSWTATLELEVDDFSYDHRPGVPPEADDLEFLSGLSRFPPGLDDRQLEELLEFHGQDEVLDFVRRDPLDAYDAAQFAQTVRDAVEPFEDVDEATLNGYRPIGPEFPGMGQHWVNAYILMRDGTNPSRPPFLSYVTTPDGVRLTGVAFGKILMDGEEIADVPFPSQWHDHTHAVDIELLALNPDAAHELHADGVRLAMLHAWTALENPDGLFSQDNWAVPFVRAGVSPPDRPTPEAGKSLFLLTGGDDYYLGLIRTLVSLDPTEERVVIDALARHRTTVGRLIEDGRVSDLDAVWGSMWREIEAGLARDAWAEVEILSR